VRDPAGQAPDRLHLLARWTWSSRDRRSVTSSASSSNPSRPPRASRTARPERRTWIGVPSLRTHSTRRPRCGRTRGEVARRSKSAGSRNTWAPDVTRRRSASVGSRASARGRGSRGGSGRRGPRGRCRGREWRTSSASAPRRAARPRRPPHAPFLGLPPRPLDRRRQARERALGHDVVRAGADQSTACEGPPSSAVTTTTGTSPPRSRRRRAPRARRGPPPLPDEHDVVLALGERARNSSRSAAVATRTSWPWRSSAPAQGAPRRDPPTASTRSTRSSPRHADGPPGHANVGERDGARPPHRSPDPGDGKPPGTPGGAQSTDSARRAGSHLLRKD